MPTASSRLPVAQSKIAQPDGNPTNEYYSWFRSVEKRSKFLERVLTPEDFGAKADDETFDNAPAFAALATELNRRGGGWVEFEDEADYCIYPTGVTPAEFSTLFSLQDLNTLKWHQNGSRIWTPFNPYGNNGEDNNIITNPNARNLIIFRLTDCKNVEFTDPFYEETSVPDGWSTYWGTRHFYVIDECRNLRWHNIRQDGGHICIEVTRTTGDAAGWDARCRDLFIDGADTKNSLYGFAFQKAGDHVTAQNIKCRNHDRSLFVYNVYKHDWDIETDQTTAQGSADNCLISCNVVSAQPQRWNTTEDIRINVKRLSVPGAAGVTTLVGLAVGYAASDAGTLGAHVRDIKVTGSLLDGDATQKSCFFRTSILSPSGPPESDIARGHVIENFDVTAVLRGGDTSGQDLIVWGRDQGFANNIVRGVKFRLITQGAGDAKIDIDCRGMTDPVDVNLTGTGFLNLRSATGKFSLGHVDCNAIERDNVSLGIGVSSAFVVDGNGHRFTHGGQLEQWGQVTVPAAATTTFSFPFHFASKPDVTVTRQNVGATGDYNAQAISATQFRIDRPAGAGDQVFTWRAVGQG